MINPAGQTFFFLCGGGGLAASENGFLASTR